MKRNLPVQKVYFILVAFVFILSSCSTWHYKIPRVSVDVDKTVYHNPGKVHSSDLTVTSRSNTMESKNELETENLSTVADASTSVQLNVEDHKKSKTFFKETTKTKRMDPSFSEKLKNDHSLLQVKDVEKTALSGWLRIMIILFAVGLLLVIIGAILSAVFLGGLWWLFYMIGSLCILAGCVVLVLGLLGIM